MLTDLIADDFSDDIREIVVELYRHDTRRNRRRVYYLVSEAAPEDRPAGLFKLGNRIAMVRSIVRADLQRRALAATQQTEHGTGHNGGPLLDAEDEPFRQKEAAQTP